MSMGAHLLFTSVVPEKSYSIWLDAHTYIVVELTTFDGRVVSFVVRLMHTFSDVEKCVARYDTAHGCPHLDIVDGTGRLLEKPLQKKSWVDSGSGSFPRVWYRAVWSASKVR